MNTIKIIYFDENIMREAKIDIFISNPEKALEYAKSIYGDDCCLSHR